MNTPDELQDALQGWDGTGDPPALSAVKGSAGFAALSPGGRVLALNQTQRNWADRLRADDPAGYGSTILDVEKDFNAARREEVERGLGADLATGALTESQVAAYVKHGTAALTNEGEAAGYVQQRYGEDEDVSGPWVTRKLPLTGADGKPVGYAYARHDPRVTEESIKAGGNDRVEMSYQINVPKTGYATHGGQGYGKAFSDPLPGEVFDPSKKNNEITGVEDVKTGPVVADWQGRRGSFENEQLQSSMNPEDWRSLKPTPEMTRRAALLDTGKDALPVLVAGEHLSSILRARPEIAEKIGQGFFAGLPGEATKGFLSLGAAAVHGPPALFGDKEALKDYGQAQQDIEGDIEGQSAAGFSGKFWPGIGQAVSREALPMAFSMGTSAAARGVQKAAEAGFLRMMATAYGQKAAVNEGLAQSLGRGLFGKFLGTAEIEGKLARQLADRVSNAVAFLPSSARTGLDNLATTLNAAEAARAGGDEKKAKELEGMAYQNAWAGVAFETLSENIWLNEMLVTRTGRSLARVSTDVLERTLKPGLMAQVTARAKRFLTEATKRGAEEGAEEIVAGVGNRAWMNEFAAQNADLFAEVPQEFTAGAILGGLLGGARELSQSGKPEAMAELMQRGLSGDGAAEAALARISAHAEEVRASIRSGTVGGGQQLSGAPAGGGAVEGTAADAMQGDPASTVPGNGTGHETKPAGNSVTRLPGLVAGTTGATSNVQRPTSNIEPGTPPFDVGRSALDVGSSPDSLSPDGRIQPAPQILPTSREEDSTAAEAPALTPGTPGQPLATPGTSTQAPIPDNQETVDEQARLAADKASTRKAVLITPGTPMPAKTPGLKPFQGDTNGHGKILYNPTKITPREIRDAVAGDVFDAKILGFSGAPVTSPSATIVTASTPGAANVQGEVISNPEELPAAVAAARAAVPGGTVEVKTPAQVVAERLTPRQPPVSRLLISNAPGAAQTQDSTPPGGLTEAESEVRSVDAILYRGENEGNGSGADIEPGGIHWSVTPGYAAQYGNVRTARVRLAKALDFRALGQSFTGSDLARFLERNGVNLDGEFQDWSGGGKVREFLEQNGAEDFAGDVQGLTDPAGHLIREAGFDGFIFAEHGSMKEPSVVVFSESSLTNDQGKASPVFQSPRPGNPAAPRVQSSSTSAPPHSRTPAPSPKAIAAAVRILRANAPELLTNVTLTTAAELSPDNFHPDDWQSITDGHGEGFYNRGTDQVTIITDNIRPRKGETAIGAVGRVIGHEVVTHRGFSALRRSDPEFAKLWKALTDEIPAEELAALLPLYPHLAEDPDKLAEEWHARHYGEKEGTAATRSLVARMWAAIKAALAKLYRGFVGITPTVLEQRAQEFVKSARKALRSEALRVQAGYTETVYHGTREQWVVWDADRAGGLINTAMEPYVAEGYAQGGGGNRRLSQAWLRDESGGVWEPVDAASRGQVDYRNTTSGEVMPGARAAREYEFGGMEQFYPEAEVKKLYARPGKILDLTTPAGVQVLAGLKVKSRRARAVVEEAARGRFDWSSTKWEALDAPLGKFWRDELVPAIKAAGYQSMRFSDDGHKTLALFDSSQMKSSEAVTYRDDGTPIPAEDRYNSHSADIRFSRALGPFDARDTPLPQWLKDKLGIKAVTPYQVKALTARAILKGDKMPSGWQQVLHKAGHEIAGVQSHMAMLSNDLRAAMKDDAKARGISPKPGDAAWTRMQRAVQLVLTGAPMRLLTHTPTREAAIKVRAFLDTLSEAIATITGGDIGDTIMDNLGEWMRRSYLAFDKDAGWSYDALTKAAAAGKPFHGRDARRILDRARSWLASEYPTATPLGIEAKMRLLSDRDVLGGALSDSPQVPKDISSLVKRRVIPKVIRELMGEVKDPLANVTNSVSFQSQFIARHDQQRTLTEMGLAAGMFSTKQEGRFTHEVGGKEGADNERWGGFYVPDPNPKPHGNGRLPIFTTPELAAALAKAPSTQAGVLASGIQWLSGFTKGNLVALNPDSAAPQYWGDIAMMVGNGVLMWTDGYKNLAEATRLTRSAKASAPGKLSPAAQALLDIRRRMLVEMTSSGITSSMGLRDLEVTMNTAMLKFSEALNTWDRGVGMVHGALLAQSIGGAFGSMIPGGGIAGRIAGGIAGGAAGLWKGEAKVKAMIHHIAEVVIAKPDRWTKMATFLTEFQTNLRAGLNREAAWSSATEKALNTVPSYEKVAHVILQLSKYGLGNSFIAFPIEVLRNFSWNMKYAVEEIASGNPVFMVRGARRLLGSSAVFAALGWGLPALVQGLFGAGVDDDKDRAYRRSLGAPWNKAATLNYTKFDKNEAQFFNASYLIPQSLISEILRSAKEGKNPVESVVDKLMQTFINGGGVHTTPMMEVFMNAHMSAPDRPITRHDGFQGVYEKLAYYVKGTMEPGAARKVERIVRAMTGDNTNTRSFSISEELRRLGGLRSYTYTHAARIRTALYNFREQRDGITQEANTLIGNTTDAARHAQIAADANASLTKLAADHAQFMGDMKTLGLASKARDVNKESSINFKPDYRGKIGKGKDGKPRFLDARP